VFLEGKAMPGMPFTPCDANQCQDLSVHVLTQVFGDVVMALATGADAGAVGASMNTIAQMFSVLNSGLLMGGTLLVSYVMIIGLVNTANDGEAMGKDWSSIWTPLRMVAGGAALLPTSAGYSFIQILVMMVSMWSIGLSNSLYETGMKAEVMTPSASQIKPVAANFWGSAVKYFRIAYCKKVVNHIYTVDQANVTAVPALDTLGTPYATSFPYETYNFEFKDAADKVGGSEPICGSIKYYRYYSLEDSGSGVKDTSQARLDQAVNGATAGVYDKLNLPEDDADEIVREAMDEIAFYSWQAMKENHRIMRENIDKFIADLPAGIQVQSTDDSGGMMSAVWPADASGRFAQIVADAQKNYLSDNAFSLVTGKGATATKNALDALMANMLAGGWTQAGAYFWRVGNIQSSMRDKMNQKAYDYIEPDMQFAWIDDDPEDAERSDATAAFEVANKMLSEAGRKLSSKSAVIGTTYTPDGSTAFTQSPKNFSPDNFATSGYESASSLTSWIQNKLATTLLGAEDPESHALMRIKQTGDFLYVASALMRGLSDLVRDVAAGFMAGVALIGSTPLTGPGVVSWSNLIQFMAKEITAPILEAVQYLDRGAFYFGVFLPMVPAATFMVGVVGWFMQVLQSMVAAPLWMLMHMRPDRTFIGSDRQGYLLLLSLFARPPLMIIGLFAGYLMADPVIDFVTLTFFTAKNSVGATGGLVGWFAEFGKFIDWVYMYGFVLFPVLLLIFGLSTSLPGVVLQWIGAGIQAMGESGAADTMRSAMQGRGATLQKQQVDRASAAAKQDAAADADLQREFDSEQKLDSSVRQGAGMGVGRGVGRGAGRLDAKHRIMSDSSASVVDQSALGDQDHGGSSTGGATGSVVSSGSIRERGGAANKEEAKTFGEHKHQRRKDSSASYRLGAAVGERVAKVLPGRKSGAGQAVAASEGQDQTISQSHAADSHQPSITGGVGSQRNADDLMDQSREGGSED
jgi:conjugal transfer/type IV secretion protein DotA/TraY